MIRFLADENFDRNIVFGLTPRDPDIVAILAQDTDLAGTDDSAVPEWAANQACIVLTHDLFLQ